ncbi:MAG: site-specific DNA-methyltransferase, partial [Chitinophagaceae bacterium]
VYNDKVNDPKILKWLHSVVGKEGEDLSRHDKWLCMMYPRLRLLHKLLAPDGAIFISIDDNEQANLKLVMDEIFGGGNFVANVIWQKRTAPDARLNLGSAHDFVVCYVKEKRSKNFNLVPLTQGREKDYKNPDNDVRGAWASVDLTGQKGHTTENQFYEINTPSGKKLTPPKNRCWAIAESTFNALNSDNRIWFGKDGNAKPRQKKFLFESEGTTVWTWWANTEVGHNQEAAKQLLEIFGDEAGFETPKPTRLIERILRLATNSNSIILDSFAGSGTTAHAVLNLNKADGGNRKYILIEMEDYAERITAERVKRVIAGYGDKEGTGGSFTYCTIGEPLFHENQTLNEAVGVAKIREYIWFTETGLPIQKSKVKSKNGEAVNAYFLGKQHDAGYYFYYEPQELTTLDNAFLSSIVEAAGSYIIYADNCLLGKAFMQQKGIIFKKIPRDITRF